MIKFHRHFIISLFLCFFIIKSDFGQNVGINNAGTAPNSSAMLDVESTTKGLLIPRVALTVSTSALPITAPATSLIVYNTATVADVTPGFYFWSGTAWTRFTTTSGAASGWATTGNSLTVDGTNFLGTTDNIPLSFRVNNQKSGRIDNVAANTFFGFKSGNVIGAGTSNTGNGYQSMLLLTSGVNNTAVGSDAMHFTTFGNQNVAIGTNALYTNIAGSDNTAAGYNSLYLNTSGSSNTAYGREALRANTTGTQNTSIGNVSMYSNTTGGNCTAAGMYALYYNTIGNQNSAFGMYSLSQSISGNNNTGCGYNTLAASTTASNNTAVGYQALSTITTGFNNTAVGTFAFSSGTVFTNSSAFGYNTIITASQQVRLGDLNVTSIGGFQNWTNVSDKRFKKDITESVPGLDFITRLRPVTYHLDMDEIARLMNIPDSVRIKKSEIEKGKMLQTGFIAQEVEKAAKDAGFDFSGVDKPKNSKDFYGLRYAEFTVPLVKAVQEQQKMIEDLKKELEKVKAENFILRNDYEQRLKRLEEKHSSPK